MSLRTIKNDAKWRLKYELFRRVLPRLQYDPFAIRHLSYKAWPKISALTAALDYSKGVEHLSYEVDEISDDGSELLKRHAENSEPVVIRNYAKDSPLASWDMDTLHSKLGDEIVEVKVGDYLADFGQPRNLDIRLGDFIDYLMGRKNFPREDLLVEGVGPYVGNQKIPKLTSQLIHPDFFASSGNGSSSFGDLTTYWLGSADALTPLHCHHFCDTFVIQLMGRRRFTLIPPHQALLVGYMPHNINIGMASFDPYSPDRDLFPGVDDIQSVDIDLGPGDALMLPGFWFHSVKLTAPSMSASRFVRSRMPAALGGGSPRLWRKPGPYQRGW